MNRILRLPRVMFWSIVDGTMRIGHAALEGEDVAYKDGKKIESQKVPKRGIVRVAISSVNDLCMRVGHLTATGEDAAFKDMKKVEEVPKE